MQCVVENRIFTGTGVLVGQTLGIILWWISTAYTVLKAYF
jgi:hypothetical protein